MEAKSSLMKKQMTMLTLKWLLKWERILKILLWDQGALHGGRENLKRRLPRSLKPLLNSKQEHKATSCCLSNSFYALAIKANEKRKQFTSICC